MDLLISVDFYKDEEIEYLSRLDCGLVLTTKDPRQYKRLNSLGLQKARLFLYNDFFANKNHSFIDTEIVDFVCKDYRLFLMKDRIRLLERREGNFTFLSRITKVISSYAEALRTNKITHVYFNSIPHQIDSFILYKVAEYMDIKCIVVSSLGTLNRFGLFMGGTFSNNLMKLGLHPPEEVAGDVQSLMIRFRKARQVDIIPKNEQIRLNTPYLYHMARIIRVNWHSPINVVNHIKTRRFYRKNAEDNTELLNESFVVSYFLHYQPERTTLPEGGIFVDQLSAIRLLRSLLPNNYVLLVKEHPTTLNYTADKNFRSISYYKEILSLPNVKLISAFSDTQALIEKSRIVATVTGSVGLEALVKKKNVIYFGRSLLPYNVGAHNYKDTLSLKVFIDSIVSSKKDCHPSLKKLQEYLVEYYASSLPFEQTVSTIKEKRKAKRRISFKLITHFIENQQHIDPL